MANPRLLNGAASPLSVYDTSTTQHHRIGTRGQLDDRVFRYARLTNATGVVSNNVCNAAIPLGTHTTETGALSTVGVAAGGIPAGTTTFTAVLGAATVADRYEDGYFKVQTAATGIGQLRKLMKHAADASLTATFTTYDPFNVVVPTGATWSLVPNPWADIIIAPGGTSIAVGVPQVVIPAATTAAPVYSWLQTWGASSVLLDATALLIGSGVVFSATVGATGVEAAGNITQRIGQSMETLTASAHYGSIFLQIAP